MHSFLSIASRLACLFAALGVGVAAIADGAVEPMQRLPAGLAKALDQEVSVGWAGVPLRDALYGVCRSRHVAVLLDRRVDPDQPVQFSQSDVPLGRLLLELGTQRELGLSHVGELVYLGPPNVARELRTLVELQRQEVADVSDATASPFAKVKGLEWPDLTEPRRLVADLLRENGLTCANLDSLPHDLWPAGRLPPLALVDRLSILLLPFGQGFECPEGKNPIRLIPLPDEPRLVRRYPARPQADAALARMKAAAPDAQYQLDNDEIVVAALLDEHERIAGGAHATTARATAGEKKSGRNPSRAQPQKRYTIRQAKGPLADLIVKLGERMEVSVRFDAKAAETAGITLSQIVSITATDATAEQVLQKVVAGTGLTVRRANGGLEVVPAARAAQP